VGNVDDDDDDDDTQQTKFCNLEIVQNKECTLDNRAICLFFCLLYMLSLPVNNDSLFIV